MFKNKKRNIIIAITLLILLVIIISSIANANKSNTVAEIPKDTIERRTLVSSISATGTIASSDIRNIMTTLSGSQIKTVNVEIGDKVNIGDTICTFDTKNIQDNLNAARKDLDNINQQGNLGISTAKRTLSDAISTRDNTIKDLQAEINKLLPAYNAAQGSISGLIADEAAKKVIFDSTVDTDPSYATVKKEYEDAQVATEAAQKAIAGYQTAIDTLNKTKDTLNSSVAGAESAVRSSELSASSGKSAYDTQIRAYTEQLQKGILTATTSGVVTSVNVNVGDIYMGSVIATIEGSEELMIETQIDQYDISDVKEGMKVYVRTDATRSEELEGIVVDAAPKASNPTVASSGVTYTVKIALNTQNERLRLGMTARLSIITESKENVLSVPYDAVYEKEDGTKYIKVEKENEEIEEIDVTIGMESNYYTEIKSEKIKESMTVILPTVESDNSIRSLINNMGARGGMIQ